MSVFDFQDKVYFLLIIIAVLLVINILFGYIIASRIDRVTKTLSSLKDNRE